MVCSVELLPKRKSSPYHLTWILRRLNKTIYFLWWMVYHLAISNNLPFSVIAEFFSRIGNSLIIEFVPKADSQVQKLLSTRKDVFLNYNKESFEKEFCQYFKIQKIHQIEDSNRVLYLMDKIR